MPTWFSDVGHFGCQSGGIVPGSPWWWRLLPSPPPAAATDIGDKVLIFFEWFKNNLSEEEEDCEGEPHFKLDKRMYISLPKTINPIVERRGVTFGSAHGVIWLKLRTHAYTYILLWSFNYCPTPFIGWKIWPHSIVSLLLTRTHTHARAYRSDTSRSDYRVCMQISRRAKLYGLVRRLIC